MADLTIIIVNYNASFWLKKVVQSIRQHYLDQTKKKIKVVIVDNGSTDDSAAVLAQLRFPWLTKIMLGENLGFARANNVALRDAITDSHYVMLLNSDIEFLPTDSNLDLLMDLIKKNPAIGVASPRLNLSDGQIDPACHRGEPTIWAALSYFLGLEKLFPRTKFFSGYHRYDLDLTSPHEIDAVSGAAMLIPSQAVAQVGLLDEQFFMYAEDLDWCRRFREAGYLVVYDPRVRLIHHKNKSGLENKNVAIRKKTNRFFWDTMLQYYQKYYPQTQRVWQSLLKTFLFIKKGGT